MKCIVLLEGGHKTTVRFDSPEALLVDIHRAREHGVTAYQPGSGGAWVFPQAVVGVVGVREERPEGEAVLPRVDQLGTKPGSAGRERQEHDALAIIPTERLFREYLHRVVRRAREAAEGENDYAIVRELRLDIGAD